MVRVPVVPTPIIRGFEPYILEMQVVGNELRATYDKSQTGELVSAVMSYTVTSSAGYTPVIEVLRNDQLIYYTYDTRTGSAGSTYSMVWVTKASSSIMSTGYNFGRLGSGILLLQNDVIRIRSLSNPSYFVPQWGRAIIKLYYV
ncbi:MAG: hypothetical protein QXI35_08180 [Candidatus Nezhaarchaeales archaeon]